LPVITDKNRQLTHLLGLAWAFVVIAALLLLIAHSTLGFVASGNDLVEGWVYDFITTSAALATLLLAVRREDDRLAWALMGMGLLCWAAGDLYTTIDPTLPFPSVADALYLVGYIPLFFGVLGYMRARVGRITAIVWTDVTMGSLCVAAIGSSLLMDYVLTNTAGTTSEIAVAVAYPTLDLIILAAAAGAIALTGWRPGRGLALVAVGLSCAALGDAVYTYQSLAGTYTSASWNNFLWPLATVLIAAGAAQPPPRRRETAPTEGWRAFATPTIFALAVLALLMLERQDMNEPAVAALTIATLAALVLRLGLTFAQNHRLVTRLETDPLTGLFNRGKLIYDLDWLYASEEPSPHVLAILDLDGFKAYNDAFGHPAGDALLVRLGRQLSAAVGEDGRAYRMGGDEFAMLIPGTEAEARPAIEAGAAALTEHGEGFQVTCSAGAAELPAEARDRANALQLADERMYRHKDSRRTAAGGEVEAVLVRIVNQRSPELAGHGDAVRRLAVAVGRDLGLSDGEIATLSRASELHDIGKIAIPDAILNKTTPLDDEEWAFIRQHTILGERIVSEAPSLAPLGRLIRASHERWDGNGYPDGLAGEDIPLAARIIFACDAYDAITAERPYSPALGPETALEELRGGAGSQFDANVVDSLERVLRTTPAEKLAVPTPIA